MLRPVDSATFLGIFPVFFMASTTFLIVVARVFARGSSPVAIVSTAISVMVVMHALDGLMPTREFRYRSEIPTGLQPKPGDQARHPRGGEGQGHHGPARGVPRLAAGPPSRHRGLPQEGQGLPGVRRRGAGRRHLRGLPLGAVVGAPLRCLPGVCQPCVRPERRIRGRPRLRRVHRAAAQRAGKPRGQARRCIGGVQPPSGRPEPGEEA